MCSTLASKVPLLHLKRSKQMAHPVATIMQGKPKARSAKAKHQPWERGSRCASVLW